MPYEFIARNGLIAQNNSIITGSLTVTGTITATTLVAQTITSSTSWITGSTKFGSLSSNTHQFTGSIYQSGSEAIFAGNVGIGTTSPSYRLQVDGVSTAGFVTSIVAKNPSTNAASSVKIGFDAGGTIWGEIGASYNSNNPYLALYVRADSEKMRITDAGNVGIGTTTPTNRLHVSGGDAIIRNAYIGIISDYGASYTSFSHTSRSGAGQYSFLSGNAGDTYINSSGSQLIYFRNNNNNLAVIGSDGNVGIGTTSPSQKLVVIGNAIISGVVYTDYVQTYSGTSIDFRHQDASVIMRVDTANARVGIGITSPSEKLEVSGSNVMIKLNATTDTFAQLGYYENGTLKWNAYNNYVNDNYQIGNSGGAYFVITSAGNVGIGTTSPSERLHVSGNGLVTGTLEVDTVNNGAGDFLTRTAGGIITRRTASEVRSDIGAQAALTNPVTGTGTTNYLPKFTGTSTIGNSQILDNGTNIGIGTTAPASKLHIVADTAITSSTLLRIDGGAVGFSGPNEANVSQSIEFWGCYYDNVTIGQTIGAAISMQKNGSWNQFDGGNGTTRGNIIFSTNSGSSASPQLRERVRIQFDGNVGIGTTSPSVKLDIQGGSLKVGSNFQIDSNGDAYQTTTGGAALWAATANVTYPTYGFYGDTGIGMYRASTDVLAFATNGSERIRINSSGNVGIGTTSPSARLSVVGGEEIASFFSSTLGGTYSYFKIFNLGPGSVAWRGNAIGSNIKVVSYAPAIDSSGFAASSIVFGSDTGQGFLKFFTTNSTTSSVALSLALTLNTDTSATFASSVTAGGQVSINAGNGNQLYLNNSGQRYTQITFDYNSSGATKGGIWWDNNESSFNLYSTTSGDLRFWTNATERMRITSGGNVGIGTTSPSQKLHLKNGILLIDSDPGLSPGLWMPDVNGNPSLRIVTDQTDASYTSIINAWGANTNSGVTLGTTRGDGTAFQVRSEVTITSGFATDSGTTRFIVLGNGNVGIGTTSPSYKLEVSGIAAASSLFTSTQGLNVSGYGFLSQTLSGQMTILGHNVRASNSVNNQTDVVNGGWISSMIKQYYNDGITFHTSPTMYSAGATYPITATERMRIDSNGNVGIGTTSPSTLLHVAGTIRTGGNGAGYVEGYRTIWETPDSHRNIGANAYQIENVTSQGLTIGYSSNQFIVVNTSGNVGIGTTAPETKFHVAGGDVLISNGQYYSVESTTGGNYKVAGLTSGNVVVIGAIDYTSAGTIFAGGDSVNITTNGVAGTSRIYINNGGNVGIGTTAPTAKFEILDVDSQKLQIDGNELYHVNDSPFYIKSSGDIVFQPNATTQVTITKAGNVGIGTTSPGQKLEVNGGSVGSNIARFTTGGGGGGTRGMTIYSNDSYVKLQVTDNAGNAASWAHLVLNPDGGNVGIGTTSPAYALDVTGTIRATSDIIAYSDARVKENVNTITNALDKVTSLRGVSYTRKDSEDKSRKVGVIAQEVLDVLPEVVQQDNNGNYSVAYGNMVGVLIEAIKEQQRQIDDLKYLLQTINK